MKNTKSYLAFLGSKYRTVKHSTYFDVYDELLSKYVNQEITFIEIGVLGGGSLFMWRDFLGPKARIIGVDLNEGAKKWEEFGFEIFIGNQSEEQFWENVFREVDGFDVVVDDGGHTYLQQITTAEMLLPRIRDKGVMVIEDTHTSYMKGFGPSCYSFIEYAKMIMDKINYRHGGLGDCSSDAELRVWSMQVFESIVAFHINVGASNSYSYVIDNNGIDDGAEDYRYRDKNRGRGINKYIYRIDFIRKAPAIMFLAKKVKYIIDWGAGEGILLRKYFK